MAKVASGQQGGHVGARSATAYADAEIERYANSATFPELHMDDDTRREVKAAWIMFVQQKGSVEEAENAVCNKLQSVDSPFAQLLYPDKGSSRKKKGNENAVDGETGQRLNADTNRTYAQILKAAADPRDGGGGGMGGGCPFAGGGGGGMGGMLGGSKSGGGRGGGTSVTANLMGSLVDEEFDKEEFVEVMKKVRQLTDAAKARGEDVGPASKVAKEEAAPRAASRGKRTNSAKPNKGRSPAPKKDQQESQPAAVVGAERRAATPSGKSTAESRRVSL